MDSVTVAPRQNDPLFNVVEQPGGWEPIKNINDPYVQEMGRFAVMEHTHKLVGASMKFIGVVRGEILQVVEGKKYGLVVEVEQQIRITYDSLRPICTELYVAIVLHKPNDGSWELLSFEPFTFTLPPFGPVIPPNP